MRNLLGRDLTFRRLGSKRGPSGAAPSFSPASLFASGEEGAWYEPSPTNCFTDTAGTTPAAVGDSVARINDSSGNGNHATQATAAARPTLQQTAGGLYYLDFDGVDDFIKATYSAEVAQPAVLLSAYSLLSASGQSLIFTGLDSSRRHVVAQGSNTNHEMFAGAALRGTKARPFGPEVARYIFNGASSSSAFNGVELVSGNAGTYATDSLTIGANWDGIVPSEINVFGVIHIGRALTAGEISDTETYLAAKSGVTL
jgi:hypothetical protein